MTPPRLALHEKRVRIRVRACLLIAGLVCCTTSGCGGNSGSKPDPAVVKRYADRGYTPDHRYETTTIQDTWTIGSEVVDIALVIPSQAGMYPLVVYLPGLGESPNAGVLWRQTWARAGYAVLSAQSTRYGRAVWSSSAARAGEFFTIAKDAFSVRSLATRTQLVQGILDETSRRQRSGSAPGFARIDVSRIAITGFDLGAQTAMMFAGENVRGVEPVQPSPCGQVCGGFESLRGFLGHGNGEQLRHHPVCRCFGDQPRGYRRVRPGHLGVHPPRAVSIHAARPENAAGLVRRTPLSARGRGSPRKTSGAGRGRSPPR